MSRAAGSGEEDLAALSERDLAALASADAIVTSNGVEVELFETVRLHFSEAEIIELTATISREICAAKFNRALEIE